MHQVPNSAMHNSAMHTSAIHDDDNVSFYNSTASTWTLATPRPTWESYIIVIISFTRDYHVPHCRKSLQHPLSASTDQAQSQHCQGQEFAAWFYKRATLIPSYSALSSCNMQPSNASTSVKSPIGMR